MELQGETPNRLNARATLPDATDSANTIFANRRFQLQKRGQLFIRTHNETLSRCPGARQQSRLFAPENPKAETPQLHPALLRSSAVIYQGFIRFRALALTIIPVGLNCGFDCGR